MQRIRPLLWLILLSLAAATFSACAGQAGPTFNETFDDTGDWSTGDDAYTEGKIVEGTYHLLIKGDDISRWASAGENFANGVYQLEATQIAGPLDNGYGMLFRGDTENGNFYLFKISGDGYVWIGRYRDQAEEQAIIGQHWFQSPAVNQGLNQTNTLRVEAESGNMIFYVNDQEVGRVTDNTYRAGDIGLFAQTLGQGGVEVQFDNFSVTPINK